jgi:hypothetical protein
MIRGLRLISVIFLFFCILSLTLAEDVKIEQNNIEVNAEKPASVEGQEAT